jgi:hypothetical protein
MADPLERVASALQRDVLHRIRELYGSVVRSRDLQEGPRSVPGFRSQRGIYKPEGSNHAFWVRQTSRGAYPDREPEIYPDGSWTYRYSPEARAGTIDLGLATNRALLRCQEDHVPIGVFRQVEAGREGPRYEVLGLAYVERFDGTHFVLRGEPIDWTREPDPETLLPKFEPFESSFGPPEEVDRIRRRQRFATVLRRLYHEKCSLCSVGYRLRGESLGLEAAHIIPVERRGNLADVRNGLLLCRNHHALFDRFGWTLDEDLRVVLSQDREFRRTAEANHIVGWEGQRLPNLPTREEDFPALPAIRWRLTEFERAEPQGPALP